MDAYRGTEGTRPYAGAGWYYAEYRQRVSTESMLLLATRLGWTRAEADVGDQYFQRCGASLQLRYRPADF